MTEIYKHGKQIESVFELLGNSENDITYSIGWTLANSNAFLNAFLHKVMPNVSDSADDLVIQLQEYKQDSGRTDIEIKGKDCHIIIEAKRGWNLPDHDQLHLYSPRLKVDSDQHNLIVAMSECSHEYALINLPTNIDNVPIKYISWKDVALLTETAKHASHAEKKLLEQLRIYLRRIVNMQNQESNMVYVVSLGSGIPEGCSISWIDIVEKKQRYFYPVGKGWPPNPPNYLGFRYRGRLQRIHHVESWKIVNNLHEEMPEIGDNLWSYPHYCFTLGPAIIQSRTIKNGKVYPSGRVWAMLDLLLTCDTVSDARDQTNFRREDGQ